MARRPSARVLASGLLVAAAALLVISSFLPYWQLTLHAPQYPNGLQTELYLTHVTGDVDEIDELNHYIGMARLGQAAPFERSMAVAGVGVLGLLLIAAVFVHNRWAALLALPALAFPVAFLADLYYWLDRFGHSLDPHAPLSSSVKPFTPALLGLGKVGQFTTTASVEVGFYLALLAVGLTIVGLYFHRRAYRVVVNVRHQVAVASA